MLALAYLASILSLTYAVALPQDSSASTGACNNSPDLCSKAYNEIVHLGCHDSPFVRDATTDYSTSGNQFFNSTVQLSAGVRLLSAQVHRSNNDWHLCHSSCDLLDAGTLEDWLTEVKTWIDNNPQEVVTILLVNSDNATPTDLATVFGKSGIQKYAYTPPDKSTPPQQWPTLNQLIQGGTRLMVFVASLQVDQIGSGQEFLMDEFTFLFENPFSVTQAVDFTCNPDRPTALKGNPQAAISSNRMFLMNHFLSTDSIFDIETPDVANITHTNSPGSDVGNLGQSANSCKTTYGKPPTFLLVDFFDQGPAIQTVDTLNGVTNPAGRITPPAASSSAMNGTSRSESTFAGVQQLVDEVKAGKHPSLGAWIWGAGKWTMGGINFNGGQILS